MTAPRKYTDGFIIIKKLFLGGLLGLQSISKQYERPCKRAENARKKPFVHYDILFPTKMSLIWAAQAELGRLAGMGLGQSWRLADGSAERPEQSYELERNCISLIAHFLVARCLLACSLQRPLTTAFLLESS